MGAAAKPKIEPDSSALLQLLLERYPNDSHITLAEVRDAAGFSASRSCDALTLGTWPSRGLVLRGFEIKVSRSDWLREFRDASKAESFAPFCDEWYLVVADAAIVQADELPDTWGLLVAKGSRLECVKPAIRNAAPLPIDRGLLVAMMKRAKEQGPSQKALAAAVAEGVAQGKRSIDSEQRRTKETADRLAALEKKVAEFEDASGVKIADRWSYTDGKRIGDAVRIVLGGEGIERTMRSRLRYTASELLSLANSIEVLCRQPEEAAKTSNESVPETSLNEKGAHQAPVNPSNHQ